MYIEIFLPHHCASMRLPCLQPRMVQFKKTFPLSVLPLACGGPVVGGLHGVAFWGGHYRSPRVSFPPSWPIRAHQGFRNDKCVEVICINKLGEQCLLFTQLLCWEKSKGGREATLPRSICNANEAYLERLPGLFISVPGEPAEEEEEERRSASITGLLSLLSSLLWFLP